MFGSEEATRRLGEGCEFRRQSRWSLMQPLEKRGDCAADGLVAVVRLEDLACPLGAISRTFMVFKDMNDAVCERLVTVPHMDDILVDQRSQGWNGPDKARGAHCHRIDDLGWELEWSDGVTWVLQDTRQVGRRHKGRKI